MTLTIELPDNAKDVVTAISALIKNAGGKIYVDEDDNLSQTEFDLLQESFKEVFLIRQGIIKAIPAPELWDE